MKEPKSFEASMQALEEIIQKLETGELPLEEALVYYEKGVAYRKHCDRILQDAEKTIVTIMNPEAEGASAE